jgi:hypothetical protein
LIKELGFEEVISQSSSSYEDVNQPLGQLGGRGKLTSKHKGGKMKISVNEPSVIMGIVSLTPRIDYSQGIDWKMNLKTMDDFHKPELSQIGFQDLITEQMHYLDSKITVDEEVITQSAGKQPAWLNYQTNTNKVRGNFADADKDMFMTLNRRYDTNLSGITDLTTYIDPSKFNYIFAEQQLDAMNFWTHIGAKITARRKMSAKQIPNI